MYELQLITPAEGSSMNCCPASAPLLVFKLYSAGVSPVKSCLRFLNVDVSSGLLTSDALLSETLLSIERLNTCCSLSRRVNFIDTNLSSRSKDDSSAPALCYFTALTVASTGGPPSRFLRVGRAVLARLASDIS